MGDIDPISEALGRIEANVTTIQSNQVTIGSDVKALKQEISDLKTNCAANGAGAACGSRTSIATWGAGAGAAIAAIFEGLRHLTTK